MDVYNVTVQAVQVPVLQLQLFTCFAYMTTANNILWH